VSHKNLRTGVECIDDHLAIGRSSDFHSAIHDIFWDRWALPVAVADVFRVRRKIERCAAIKRYLSLVAAFEALHATPVESPMKFCHERESVRRQNFGVSGCDFTDNLDSIRNFVER